MDDDTNKREAQARSQANGTEVSTAEYLHLFKLSGLAKVKQYFNTYNTETDKVTFLSSSATKSSQPASLVPNSDDEMMLYFPYRDLGKRVDTATKDLLIFGHPLFSFTDDSTHLQSYQPGLLYKKEKHSMYKTVILTRQNYYKLKAKTSSSRTSQ